ncbi:MAG: phosphoribosylformylglycinamidine cyclo-ligase [Bacillota bacterium]|nr:phosphoribosylformylglycinamidine cyclo-ligase [Bacillota bacterium]
MGISYKDAGVDIDNGAKAVELMGEHVKSTFRPGVLTDIGSFGGLFQLDISKFSEPVLVSGTDGVGTKLQIAMKMDKHDTIGIDAVAMCVNDILVQGATPLFFLDYLATGKLDPVKIAEIVKGVAEGCRQSQAALIGGETAEMPDFYGEDEYDIAGFAVGAVNKDKIVDGSRTESGDVMLALPSTGVHSNGFSLVRKLVFDTAGLSVNDEIPELGCTLGQELLKPTRIYVKDILPLLDKYDVKGMCHITGGGLIENLPRSINNNLNAVIDVAWPAPPVFDFLQKIGKVDDVEMHRVFNMGIGYIVITDQYTAWEIQEANPEFMQVGFLEPGSGKTEIMGVNV